DEKSRNFQEAEGTIFVRSWQPWKQQGILITLARFLVATWPRTSGNANREQFGDVGGPSTLNSRVNAFEYRGVCKYAGKEAAAAQHAVNAPTSIVDVATPVMEINATPAG
ncbi:hypothetical protein K0M31_007397, partial [Melipona bicolor]